MRIVRTVATAALAATIAGLVVATPAHGTATRTGSAGPPASATTSPLPPPTGHYQVGSADLHLVDHQRRDPWKPTQQRQIMATVFYPARDAAGHPLRRYISKAVLPALPLDFSFALGVLSNSHTDAPADIALGRRPVILLSPGFAIPRTLYSLEAEDLASHGYVVITSDYTYETGVVQFPDGRIAKGVTGDLTDQVLRTAYAARLADTKFLLGRLTAIAHGAQPDADDRRLPTGFGRLLDLSRIAMIGHSAGGSTTAQTMYTDHRILAGVDLDGPIGVPQPPDVTPYPAARHGLTRPLLLMSSDDPGLKRANAPTWNLFAANDRAAHQIVIMKGSMHFSYSDLPAFAPLSGASPEEIAEQLGPIAPARSIHIVRTYVLAMFDHYLRHRPESVLRGPSPLFPDVEFPALPLPTR